MRAAVDFDVSADDMRRFASLSGDLNPLHNDEKFARAKGYSGAVVYAGLILAKVSQLIGMELPGRDAVWTAVNLNFRKPLYVGSPARVEAEIESLSEATRAVVLKIEVRSAGAVIANGRAEVLIVA